MAPVAIASVSPSSGPVSERISVAGYGFASASTTTVRVDSVTVTPDLITDSAINFDLPYLAAGSYQLVVEQRDAEGTVTASTSSAVAVTSPTLASVSITSYAFVLNGANMGSVNSSIVNGSSATRVMLDSTIQCEISSWTSTQISGNMPTDVLDGTHTLTLVREAAGGVQSSNGLQFSIGGGNGLSSFGISSVAKVMLNPTAGLSLRAKWGGHIAAANRTAITRAKNALPADSYVSIGTATVNDEVAAMMLADESKLCMKPIGYATVFGPADMSLSDNAEITVAYDSADIPQGKTSADLALYNWDSEHNAWLEMASVLGNGGLTASVSKLSLYQVMVKGVSPTAVADFGLRQFYVYPNPAKNGNKPILHLECGVGDSVNVRIYDIAGELRHSARIDGVPNITSPEYAYEYTWDCGGAGSGVYIAVVEAHKAGYGDIKVKKTFAVVR